MSNERKIVCLFCIGFLTPILRKSGSVAPRIFPFSALFYFSMILNQGLSIIWIVSLFKELLMAVSLMLIFMTYTGVIAIAAVCTR